MQSVGNRRRQLRQPVHRRRAEAEVDRRGRQALVVEARAARDDEGVVDGLALRQAKERRPVVGGLVLINHDDGRLWLGGPHRGHEVAHQWQRGTAVGRAKVCDRKLRADGPGASPGREHTIQSLHGDRQAIRCHSGMSADASFALRHHGGQSTAWHGGESTAWHGGESTAWVGAAAQISRETRGRETAHADGADNNQMKTERRSSETSSETFEICLRALRCREC